MSLLLLFLAMQAAPTEATVEKFRQSFHIYNGCIVNTVKLGMTTKMEPAVFKAGFAKSCLVEEEAFRQSFVQVVIESGKTPEQARTEVDENIAKGRAVYIADQASYVNTGSVPK
jgi:hypothetical protein